MCLLPFRIIISKTVKRWNYTFYHALKVLETYKLYNNPFEKSDKVWLLSEILVENNTVKSGMLKTIIYHNPI